MEEEREQRKQGLAQVLELEEGQLRGVPVPTPLARGAQLYSRFGAAARERPKETFALSRYGYTSHVACLRLFFSRSLV